MGQPLVELVDIRKRYGTGEAAFEALRGVSFSIDEGEFVAIMGASGSGKSTLLHAVGGLDTIDSGEVRVAGTSLSGLSQKALGELRNRSLGFVYQFHHLLPEFTALDNVAMPLWIRREDQEASREEARRMLEAVGLGHRLQHLPSQLSGGERQRVAIARALAPEPRLVIADEPVSALDVSIQSQILNLLIALARDLSLTMIFISHDLSVVHYIADRIAVMRKGRIVEYGEADKVFSSPSHEYTQARLAAVPRL